MKIVAVNGSHRGRGGNTDIMVTAFLQGARAAGAETANILLAEREIGYCRACKACWFRSPGRCVLKDDMAATLATLAGADVWVWATPLYFDNITSRLKTFIDRLMVLGSPRWARDAAGECRHLTTAAMPRLMLIANCGFPERSHFQVISHWLQRHARNLGTEVIGEIYASEGALLSTTDGAVPGYLQALATAGGEIAAALRLSPATAVLLAQPFLPAEAYSQGAEQYIAAMLKNQAGQ